MYVHAFFVRECLFRPEFCMILGVTFSLSWRCGHGVATASSLRVTEPTSFTSALYRFFSQSNIVNYFVIGHYGVIVHHVPVRRSLQCFTFHITRFRYRTPWGKISYFWGNIVHHQVEYRTLPGWIAYVTRLNIVRHQAEYRTSHISYITKSNIVRHQVKYRKSPDSISYTTGSNIARPINYISYRSL